MKSERRPTVDLVSRFVHLLCFACFFFYAYRLTKLHNANQTELLQSPVKPKHFPPFAVCVSLSRLCSAAVRYGLNQFSNELNHSRANELYRNWSAVQSLCDSTTLSLLAFDFMLTTQPRSYTERLHPKQYDIDALSSLVHESISIPTDHVFLLRNSLDSIELCITFLLTSDSRSNFYNHLSTKLSIEFRPEIQQVRVAFLQTHPIEVWSNQMTYLERTSKVISHRELLRTLVNHSLVDQNCLTAKRLARELIRTCNLSQAFPFNLTYKLPVRNFKQMLLQRLWNVFTQHQIVAANESSYSNAVDQKERDVRLQVQLRSLGLHLNRLPMFDISSWECVRRIFARKCAHQFFSIDRPLTAHLSSNRTSLTLISPMLEYRSHNALATPNYVIMICQLASSFFGISMINFGIQLLEPLPAKNENWRKRVSDEGKKHKIMKASVRVIRRYLLISVFGFCGWQMYDLCDEFFLHNVYQRERIAIDGPFPVPMTISICIPFEYAWRVKYNLKLGSCPFKSDQTIDFDWRSLTIRDIDRLTLYEKCFINSPMTLRNTTVYYRNEAKCIRTSILINPYLNPTAYLNKLLFGHQYIDHSNCPTIACRQSFFHPAHDLRRSHDRPLPVRLLFQRILVQKRLPGYRQPDTLNTCHQYPNSGHASQAACFESCYIRQYVRLYGKVPVHVSFDPKQYPANYSLMKFSSIPDSRLDRLCRSNCDRPDCESIQIRPILFEEPSRFIRDDHTTEFVFSDRTLTVYSEQAIRLSLNHFLLHVLSYVNFCFGLSLLRAGRLFTRLQVGRKWNVGWSVCNMLIALYQMHLLVNDYFADQLFSESLLKHEIDHRPPSLTVCTADRESQFYGYKPLPVSNVAHLLYRTPNERQVWFDESNQTSMQVTEYILSMSFRCFQFNPLFKLNDQHNDRRRPLYQLALITSEPLTLVWLSLPGNRLLEFYLNNPIVFTYQRVQVQYLTNRPNHCNRYPTSSREHLVRLIQQELPRKDDRLMPLLHSLDVPLQKLSKLQLRAINKAKPLLMKLLPMFQLPDCDHVLHMPYFWTEREHNPFLDDHDFASVQSKAGPNARVFTVHSNNLVLNVFFLDRYDVWQLFTLAMTVCEIFLDITFNHLLFSAARRLKRTLNQCRTLCSLWKIIQIVNWRRI